MPSLEWVQVSPRSSLRQTAAPHHGQAYGSIIIVDPRVRDDDAMAPVKRVTSASSPVPFSPPLEDAHMPTTAKLVAAVLGM